MAGGGDSGGGGGGGKTQGGGIIGDSGGGVDGVIDGGVDGGGVGLPPPLRTEFGFELSVPLMLALLVAFELFTAVGFGELDEFELELLLEDGFPT